jgi:hypothetical protein
LQDLNLPKSIVTRLAKGVLPANTQIQGNAVLALSKSATVFVSYLSSRYADLPLDRLLEQFPYTLASMARQPRPTRASQYSTIANSLHLQQSKRRSPASKPQNHRTRRRLQSPRGNRIRLQRPARSRACKYAPPFPSVSLSIALPFPSPSPSLPFRSNQHSCANCCTQNSTRSKPTNATPTARKSPPTKLQERRAGVPLKAVSV